MHTHVNNLKKSVSQRLLEEHQNVHLIVEVRLCVCVWICVVCCDVLPCCVVCCDVLRVDACCVTCAVLCCALGPFGLLCVAMSWVAWDCVEFNTFRCTCDCVVSALSVRCAKCRQNWASCMLLHLYITQLDCRQYSFTNFTNFVGVTHIDWFQRITT